MSSSVDEFSSAEEGAAVAESSSSSSSSSSPGELGSEAHLTRRLKTAKAQGDEEADVDGDATDDEAEAEAEEQDADASEATATSTTGRTTRDNLPVTLSCRDLTYEVRIKSAVRELLDKVLPARLRSKQPVKRAILHDITATFPAGTVTAVMGLSGAGKTTLLNVLSRRISKITSGALLANGNNVRKMRNVANLMGYVMQDDVMWANLTPREIVNFTATMRLPASLSLKEKRRRTEALLADLGLLKCANTRIGEPGVTRGVSGGERKRSSIAIELIAEPRVLILDEPTTGLDSSTSLYLLARLQRLAHVKKYTVIITLHQPSSDIFQMFDHLMLLSLHGEVIFHGEAQRMCDYFARVGYQCPDNSNPADFALNLACPVELLPEDRARHADLLRDVPARDERMDARVVGIGEDRIAALRRAYLESPEYRAQREATEAPAKPLPKKLMRRVKANFFMQLGVLLWRAGLNARRDPMNTYALLMQTVIMALVQGIVFLDAGRSHSQTSISDRSGALFFLVTSAAFLAHTPTLTRFSDERKVFMREHSSSTYDTLPYYLAKNLAELPFNLFFPMLSIAITYWMIGFQADAGNFFIFLAVIVLTSLLGQALALVLSAGAKPALAFALSPVTMMPQILFAGLLINSGSQGDWYAWVKWASFVRYGFTIISRTEFKGLNFDCSASERTASGRCPVDNGSEALDNLHFDLGVWQCFLIMVVLLIGYHMAAYLLLRFGARKKVST